MIPGVGVAPTPAASEAVELLLFYPGMIWWTARDLRPAQPVKSRWLKLSELAVRKMEPPAGNAPARLRYKGSGQASA